MKVYFYAIAIMAVILSSCNCQKEDISIANAEKSIAVKINTDNEGKPFYRVFYNGEMVLDTSFLGLDAEGLNLKNNLHIEKVTPAVEVVDNYKLFQGKQRNINYDALNYSLIFKNENNIPLECEFSLSKNGVAFRYKLTEANAKRVKILAENSTFGFPRDTKAWMQPMSVAKTGWCETNPSYEEHYQMDVAVDHKSPLGVGYIFPALFKVNNNWVLLSETDVQSNYCGTKLQYDNDLHGMKITFPQKEEVFTNGELLPNGKLPFTSPWRTIAIGGINNIVESTLATDLASPAIDMDIDFIKSGLSSWSWVLLKDDFTNYETSHRFIDYASEMNWPYCLIDADWDWKIGYERMQELVDYAKSKNVKILLWYNSSGDWNSTVYTPKSKLLTAEDREKEFALLEKMGVAGCKIDFFGGDGQSMMEYYHEIMKDAARHKLMLNFHGATLPRGWERTYPNLMTTEAIKGQEFITFEQEIADQQPSHCAVIPFTRNVYEPMDFTPMVLDSIPRIIRRTTTTFELALPILFTSGIQHIAEIPEGMKKMPDYIVNFLKDIPTLWDETRFVAGFPGKDVVVARRKDNKWFVVGINGENITKTIKIDLSFIKNNEGVLFFDDDSKIPQHKSISSEISEITLKPNGGFVMKF